MSIFTSRIGATEIATRRTCNFQRNHSARSLTLPAEPLKRDRNLILATSTGLNSNFQ
ncbi:MAG: hypothetical protein V7K68_32610 [Nostoc sp.]|uniref:hypothetical protein n=1 Tax=Nostoc sp. TaxID=1180 RepID=UPI002FF62A58